MNFATAARVLQAIRNSDEVECDRGENRVKINNAANCVPYFKPEEARKIGMKLNVNWGELMIILQHARLQYLNAFWSELAFFKVTLPLAPPDHAAEWAQVITTEINTPMKESLTYFELHNSRWCSVVSHGAAPQIWPKRGKWCPKYVPLEDIRIATDTTLDFENLDWFACRYAPTPYELVNDVWPETGESRWDKKAVAQILKNYKNINYDYPANNYDWESSPEKLADWMRQDGGHFSSTAMPAIPLWRFYFKDETTENKGWFMRIVPETGAVRGSPPDDFLWPAKSWRDKNTERPVAEKREHLLHAQFGDLNAKAPFTWHGMRSLGMALMEPTFYMNLTRCKLLQHVLDNFNIWLRVTDPIDKARATVQEFANMGVLKTGVSVIPQQERHQIDAGLVEAVMANLKQLQVEASASYTQQSDTGSQKEQTAFETSVKLQQVNALMGGLLMKSFIYAKHEYKETCRRFCLPPEETTDPDILKFRKRCCQMAGIPPQWLDVDLWDIQPITPIGMGNPTLAEAKANELLQIRPLCDPTAQQEILHDVILVKTNDPRRAQRWAPLGKEKMATPGQKVAESDYSVLIRGLPARPMEGISLTEQVETLIGLLAGEISFAEASGNMASARDVKGMNNVVQYVSGLIQRLEQDRTPQTRQFVQEAKGRLSKLSNSIRGFEQRLQEMAKKQAQAAQEQNGQLERAKTEAEIRKSQTDSALKVRKARMDEGLKRQQFVGDQRRKDAAVFSDIKRGEAQTRSEISRKNELAKAQAAASRMKSLPEK